MKIAVCVKPIPDPSIVSLDEQDCLEKDDLVHILNPRDLVAVEAAVSLKESHAAEDVTIVSIAPPAQEDLLRRCLAGGADRVVRLWDASLDRVCNDASGRVLARLISHLHFDLILCGQKASDDEMGFTGYVIAAELGIPFIQRVVGIEMRESGKIAIRSRLEGGNREMIEADLPAVLGIEQELNEPRYASLPSLIAALRASVERYDLTAVGISGKDIDTKIQCIGFSVPRPRPKKLFTPDSSLSAAERMRLIMSGGIAEKQESLFEGSPEEMSLKFTKFLGQLNIKTPWEDEVSQEK